MGRVVQASLAAVSLLTPAPLRVGDPAVLIASRRTPRRVPRPLIGMIDQRHVRALGCDTCHVDFRLRRAVPADAEAVADVYVTSWNEGFAGLMPPRVMDAIQVARWEHDLGETSLRWWLAHAGPTMLGFVGTGPSRDPIDLRLGELDTIAVSPSAWRHGLGRRLMVAALGDLRCADYRECILWTLAEYEMGRRFYEATGWHATGEVRDSGSQIAFSEVVGVSARARSEMTLSSA